VLVWEVTLITGVGGDSYYWRGDESHYWSGGDSYYGWDGDSHYRWGGDSLLLAGIGKSSQRDQWTGIGHYKLSQVCFRASGCMLTLVSRDSSQSSKYFHASRIKQLDMRGKQKLAY